MNNFFLLIFLSLLLFNPADGQLPPVGIIDFYGLRRISEKDVLSVLKIKPGDDAMETLKSLEENRTLLKSLPNVEDASISLICCDDFAGQSMIFVGIREKGTPPLSFRPAPKGMVRLPEKIVQAGQAFQAAFLKALEIKDFSEDDSQGHALLGNREVRQVQESFIVLAARNLKILRQVLHQSSEAQHRALAAQIIAYSKDKKGIIKDLVYGVSDPDQRVRNDATRGLIILAKYSQTHPGLGIKIPMNIFVKMLNSLEWSDRNKSVGILDTLTEKRDTALLTKIRREALTSLIEMAGWKNPNHAQSAFYILSRIAGFPEAEFKAMWKSGAREKQMQKVLERIKRL